MRLYHPERSEIYVRYAMPVEAIWGAGFGAGFGGFDLSMPCGFMRDSAGLASLMTSSRILSGGSRRGGRHPHARCGFADRPQTNLEEIAEGVEK
jgi:hypothetical protein